MAGCPVEPQKRRRVRKQITEAGTDHDDAIFEFLSLEDQGFEVERSTAAQPEDDRSAFMVDAQFHGSHSILPRFGRWYAVSVDDDLRIDKDTADLAGRSAVLLILFSTFKKNGQGILALNNHSPSHSKGTSFSRPRHFPATWISGMPPQISSSACSVTIICILTFASDTY